MQRLLTELPRTIRDDPSSLAMQRKLGDIARSLHDAVSLPAAESALDQARDAMGIRWSCWNGDITSPQTSQESIRYSIDRGWPIDVLDFWQDHYEPLRVPVYIRSRFEHFPFVATFERVKKSRYLSTDARLIELLRKMDADNMLIVPIHLPKGQIGMIGWLGNISRDILESMARAASMELMAIGNNFMRIYRNASGYDSAADEELSRLTPREWDCVRILAQGYREPDAAVVLGLTKSTVRFHLNNVVRKFGCKNRTQAIALAAQLGLLGPIGP